MRAGLDATVTELVERIITLDPYRVILFGSLAEGVSTVNSDIDLIVVTNSDIYPENRRL